MHRKNDRKISASFCFSFHTAMPKSASDKRARNVAKIVTRSRLQILNVMYLRCFIACRESGPEKPLERSKICEQAFEEQLKDIAAVRDDRDGAASNPDIWWSDKLQHLPYWHDVVRNIEVRLRL